MHTNINVIRNKYKQTQCLRLWQFLTSSIQDVLISFTVYYYIRKSNNTDDDCHGGHTCCIV